MNTCICCREELIRHVNHHRIYWFCPHCHQEMPSLEEITASSRTEIPKAQLDRSTFILIKQWVET